MSIEEEDLLKLKEALKKFATNLNTTSKIGTENAMLLFITLKEDSKLLLPTMKNLVSIDDDNVINLSKISDLLKNYTEEIESIELYHNEVINKVVGLELENVKKFDILL